MLKKVIINGRIQFVSESMNINNIVNKKPYATYTNPNNKNIKTKANVFDYYHKPNKNIELIDQNKAKEVRDIKKQSYNNHLKENITIETTSIIPNNLFQTWHSLDLPYYMKKNSELLKENNPEFNYYVYDDKMCRDFIMDYFDEDTLFAYDSLIPGAFKADLWRYCILYVYGGIYLDIKYNCVEGFKLISMINEERFVRDYNRGIYQAFLVCLPKNEILMKCIHSIIQNVKNESYLTGPLDITGPQLMNRYFTRSQINNLELQLNNYHIELNNIPILYGYSEYKSEQSKNELYPHYSIMWLNKQVYKSEPDIEQNKLIEPDNIINNTIDTEIIKS
jgi:mannosyltransferase OCH1-like enzyme